jgi:hypothetical protein
LVTTDAIFWLGLVLPICYVPGVTGASIPTQWAVLAAVLPLGLWRQGELTGLHWVGIWFIFYSALSLLWAVNPYDSVWGFAVVLIWAGSFWLGSTLESLEGLWKGLAIGLSVSSVVAVAQLAGFHPVLEAEIFPPADPGLLYSPLVSGSVSALVIVGLVCHRLWRYIPGVLPLLILSHNRGGWLVVAVGLAGRYLGWRIAAGIVLFALVLMVFHPWPLVPSLSDIQRMQVWDAAYSNLRWFGLGPGTFTDLWMMVEVSGEKVMERPEFAHNDYIQFIFEAGCGSVLVFALMAAVLAQSETTEWPVFAGFAALAIFYFPLHSPLSAFIGCVAAGRIVRDWVLVRDFEREFGSDFLPGDDAPRSAFDSHRGKVVSVEP